MPAGTTRCHGRERVHPSVASRPTTATRLFSLRPRLMGRFIQEEEPREGASNTSSFDWTGQYERIQQCSFHSDEQSIMIPVMPLKKVKLVTDTVQLNVFEPRYRTMMRLVKRSQSRVFGVTLRE